MTLTWKTHHLSNLKCNKILIGQDMQGKKKVFQKLLLRKKKQLATPDKRERPCKRWLIWENNIAEFEFKKIKNLLTFDSQGFVINATSISKHRSTITYTWLSEMKNVIHSSFYYLQRHAKYNLPLDHNYYNYTNFS